jgi:hypothetical protein
MFLAGVAMGIDRRIPQVVLVLGALLLASSSFSAPPGGGDAGAPEISFGQDGVLLEKPIFMEGAVGNQAVDDEGRIYDERQYGGIVPDRRDRFEAGPKAGVPQDKTPRITWVGFQQRILFSRIFIQTDQSTGYRVYKPDPLHIYIELDGAELQTRNDQRELVTVVFDSPVDRVQSREIKSKSFKGTRILVTLDRPAGYLYKQEGDYVFIDIER